MVLAKEKKGVAERKIAHSIFTLKTSRNDSTKQALLPVFPRPTTPSLNPRVLQG
jgi:hypothetical protein